VSRRRRAWRCCSPRDRTTARRTSFSRAAIITRQSAPSTIQRLRHLRIGVQLIGDDFANAPPAHALANRGIVRNVVGYPVYGDYRQSNPPARIVDAVARGDIDVGIVWGPLAGYFAQRSAVPLDLVPVSPRVDLPYLPFVFDIAMGVRRGDTTFRARLNEILERRQPAIDSILDTFGVPRLGFRTGGAS
jgi:mxaJ protein